jgi:hypothetical protein
MCHFCKYRILRNYQKTDGSQITRKVRNFFALSPLDSMAANFFREPNGKVTNYSIHFGGQRVSSYAAM